MEIHHQTHLPHPANHLYNAAYTTAQYKSCLPPNDDSSRSHHSRQVECDRTSPNYPDNASSYLHQTVYGSFYKTLPADYTSQNGRNFGSYPGDTVMDFSQKAVKHESESPPSPHSVSSGGYQAVGGVMVSAQLDSDGSSVKSSASDAGSDTSEGHSATQSHYSVAQNVNRASPLPNVDGDIDTVTPPANDKRDVPTERPMNEQTPDHMTTIQPITEPYKHHKTPERYTGHQNNSDEESPEPGSPRTPENSPDSSSEKTGSAKKQRLCSPNLNKIEAVINNLRTAKAKKKERNDPVSLKAANGAHPPAVTQQYPRNDPQSLWAMYALSQYAMMTPGVAAGSFYPYQMPEGTAYPYHLQAQQALMAQQGLIRQHSNASRTISPSSNKRKQPESGSEAEHRYPHPSTPTELSSTSYHQPPQDVKAEPLDFSCATSQSPPHAEKSASVTYSPSQRLERLRSPATKAKNCQAKEVMMSDHNTLWHDLTEMSASVPGVRTLLESYQRSIDEFETERYRALLDNISSDQCKDAVHAYFNQERHSLVHRMREQLGTAQKRVETAAAQSLVGMSHGLGLGRVPPSNPFIHGTSSPITAATTTASITSYPYASALYGLANNLPNPSQTAGAAAGSVPNFGAYSPMASYMATAMVDDAAVMYGQNLEDPDNGGKRKFLTPEAVSLLQAWYDENAEHPYPDEETVEELAQDAMVSPAQVKKWMANKRVRSSNTLAFNGSIHPKKIQKLIQLKEMAEKNGVQNVAYNATANTNHTQQASAMAPSMSVKPRASPAAGSAKKNKRLLDPSAVAYMTQWYHEHIMYPYPTDDEKHQIADACCLSVSQVTCWFANKRNRSNHSRKHSLVDDRSAMVGKLTIYDSVKAEDRQSDASASTQLKDSST